MQQRPAEPTIPNPNHGSTYRPIITDEPNLDVGAALIMILATVISIINYINKKRKTTS